MKPVFQTNRDPPDGNCFPACVASILERSIEDVDIDVASCKNSFHALRTKVEQRANCRIYTVSHEAILEGIVKTSERYCIAEVCICVFNNDPHNQSSTWHAVVCEITNDGKLSLLHNPDQHDLRQQSLEQFSAIRNLFFVKENRL